MIDLVLLITILGQLFYLIWKLAKIEERVNYLNHKTSQIEYFLSKVLNYGRGRKEK